MARKRGENEPSSYQPQGDVPEELTLRHALVMEVLARRMSISEAAEKLGIARVNMQTLVHRVQTAITETVAPQPTGPKPTPPRERALAAELTQAQKRIVKLEAQLLAMDDMLGTAGEIIRQLRGLPPKSGASSSRRSRRSRIASTTSDDGEPEPSSSRMPLSLMTRVATRVATRPEVTGRAARALGVRPHTIRRLRRRLACGQPLLMRRGGRRVTPTTAQEHALRDQVRTLRGLAGADSLARSVAGVSRRAAAAVKRDELAAMERERQAACGRVLVTVPGVIRGFDAMHLDDGYALVAADAAVAFRTSVTLVPTYDTPHVAHVLDADFDQHGPPLVVRLDRARCHQTPAVLSVLKRHGVLLLHGPAHHPGYYGQLERQNREHRDWLARDERVSPATIAAMTTALNAIWRRPTLGWRTAAEEWADRPRLLDDRKELDDDVNRRAAHLRGKGLASDLAMRLAIEQALIERGYLRITTGQKLLRE
jgi:transposase-like protein